MIKKKHYDRLKGIVFLVRLTDTAYRMGSIAGCRSTAHTSEFIRV